MISFLGKYYHNRDQLDDVGFYVQSVGGYFETHRSFEVEFYVPVEYREFILIKYPFLEEVEYIL
jgi:hypothetical protein